jgi:hypothetical protein
MRALKRRMTGWRDTQKCTAVVRSQFEYLEGVHVEGVHV